MVQTLYYADDLVLASDNAEQLEYVVETIIIYWGTISLWLTFA